MNDETKRLDDEALADLLAKAEAASRECASGPLWDAPDVAEAFTEAAHPATVSALVLEVQAARKALHDAMRLWDSGEDPSSVLSMLRNDLKGD